VGGRFPRSHGQMDRDRREYGEAIWTDAQRDKILEIYKERMQ